MDRLWMDVRYCLRTLAKSPAFALTAIPILALGIGATTAIFSVVNAVLIRPLPYHQPERLVALSSLYQRAGVSRTYPTVSLNEAERWRAESRSLESVGSFVFTALPVNIDSHAIFLVAIGADPELLSTLGISPAMGRNLAGSGSKVHDQSAIISHRLWMSAFHGDQKILGRGFSMDGDAFTVTGVLPASFQFPRSDSSYSDEEPDIIFPVANIAEGWGRDSTQWFAIGRLKSGVPLAQADTELKAITARMTADTPSLRGMSVRLTSLDAETSHSVRTALLLTLGISIVLLLIASTNIMNLLFSRAAQRTREMAVRQAIGATSWQLVRQMLTESACLTFLSGAIGIGLASLLLDSLVSLSPAHLPISGHVGIDWRVLSFAFLVCATASVIAGVLPALHRSRQQSTPLASGTRTSGSRALAHFQRGLMVTQIALGVGLLAAAGVLTHSLFHLSSTDPGFRTQDTVGFELAFPNVRPRDAPPLYDRILQAVRTVPGVASAGWITNLPPETRAGVFIGFTIPGAPTQSRMVCNFQVTSDGYFRTAGIALTHGRDFTAADTGASPPVAIVNEALARQYFHNEDPIGKHVSPSWTGTQPREIIGVIRDIHDRGLDTKSPATIYVPYRQFALGYGSIVARTNAPAESVLPEIRRRLALAEPGIPIRGLTTIRSRLNKTMDAPRFYTVIALACALMAVLFVTMGLYGVISYTVSRRTSEIGIRMALGAPRAGILRGVLWQGLQLATAGTILGIAFSLATTRLLTSLLFEIKPVDPVTLSIAAAFAVVVTLAASYLPARRASRVDPLIALRHDS